MSARSAHLVALAQKASRGGKLDPHKEPKGLHQDMGRRVTTTVRVKDRVLKPTQQKAASVTSRPVHPPESPCPSIDSEAFSSWEKAVVPAVKDRLEKLKHKPPLEVHNEVLIEAASVTSRPVHPPDSPCPSIDSEAFSSWEKAVVPAVKDRLEKLKHKPPLEVHNEDVENVVKRRRESAGAAKVEAWMDVQPLGESDGFGISQKTLQISLTLKSFSDQPNHGFHNTVAPVDSDIVGSGPLETPANQQPNLTLDKPFEPSHNEPKKTATSVESDIVGSSLLETQANQQPNLTPDKPFEPSHNEPKKTATSVESGGGSSTTTPSNDTAQARKDVLFPQLRANKRSNVEYGTPPDSATLNGQSELLDDNDVISSSQPLNLEVNDTNRNTEVGYPVTDVSISARRKLSFKNNNTNGMQVEVEMETSSCADNPPNNNDEQIGANLNTIIFTDESNVILEDDVLASFNLNDDNVIIVPLETDTTTNQAGNPDSIEIPLDVQVEEQGVIPDGDGNGEVPLADDFEAPLSARSRRPETWKRNKTKAMKNMGLEHVSLRGKLVKAAEIKSRCNKDCKRSCHKVTDEERKKIFENFYKHVDRADKWRFICSFVRVCNIKKRTVIIHDDSEARRKCSYEYFLPVSSLNEVQVCQNMFVNTLGISVQTVRTALSKKKNKFGTVSPNKMGKSSKKSERSKKIDKSILEHISRFPTVESHYCRKNSKARYLEKNLNRRKMHSLYVIECQSKGMKKEEIGTLRRYRDIFKTLKLKFYKPKKDQCPKCVAWSHKTPNQKTPEETENMNEHLAQKRLSRQLKEDDAEFVKAAPENRKELCVATCDLQQILSTPKGENGELFYKTKFSSYNFTIFVSGEQQGYCYTWNQTQGKKGCTEVTSSLWDFIKMKVNQGIKEFRFYSDNCAAQNKNQYLFSMYVLASIRYNLKIVHRYLEKGHTQMQCDTMHARIENHMEETDVFHPKQWITAMKTAKISKPRYIVKEMTQEELLDFAPLAEFQTWRQVKTSLIREVIVNGEEPGTIRFRRKFDEEETIFRQIMKRRSGRPVNFKTFPLKKKYNGLFPVRPDVLKGLQDLCKSGAIPQEFASFYMVDLANIAVEAEEAAAAAQQQELVINHEESDYSDVGSETEEIADESDEDDGNEDDGDE